LVEFPIIQA